MILSQSETPPDRQNLAGRLGIDASNTKKPLLSLVVNSGGGKDLGAAAAAPKSQPVVNTKRQAPKAAMPSSGMGKAVMETTYNKHMRWQNKQDEPEASAREVNQRHPPDPE